MFCANCGAKLPDDALFCPFCGTKVEVQGNTGESMTGAAAETASRAVMPEQTIENIPAGTPAPSAPRFPFPIQAAAIVFAVIGTVFSFAQLFGRYGHITTYRPYAILTLLIAACTVVTALFLQKKALLSAFPILAYTILDFLSFGVMLATMGSPTGMVIGTPTLFTRFLVPIAAILYLFAVLAKGSGRRIPSILALIFFFLSLLLLIDQIITTLRFTVFRGLDSALMPIYVRVFCTICFCLEALGLFLSVPFEKKPVVPATGGSASPTYGSAAAGAASTPSGTMQPNIPGDAPSTGYSVLCFFFPVIGLILYLVWKDQFPLRAKSCGKGAIIGVIVYVALIIALYAIQYWLIFHIFW